jgi:hypothetical protein
MEDKERVIEVNSKIMDFISVRFGSLSDNFVSFLFDLDQYLDGLKVDRYFYEFHYFGSDLDDLVISYKFSKVGEVYSFRKSDMVLMLRDSKIEWLLDNK